MVSRRKRYVQHQQHYMFGDYCFEVVSLISHGSTVSENLDKKEEMRRRIAAGNGTYFALNKILKSRLVTQSMKFRFYKP